MLNDLLTFIYLKFIFLGKHLYENTSIDLLEEKFLKYLQQKEVLNKLLLSYDITRKISQEGTIFDKINFILYFFYIITGYFENKCEYLCFLFCFRFYNIIWLLYRKIFPMLVLDTIQQKVKIWLKYIDRILKK